ncbi:MAG: tetratricopeptide repeat-containing protein, partial [Alphaproteobacteria bacterium]
MAQPRLAAIETPKSVLPILGTARIARLAYEGGDVAKVWDHLLTRVNSNHMDAGAFLDISVILQTAGERDKALLAQSAALEISRTYEIRHGHGDGIKVLAFVTAGDFMANTPIDFLLEESNATLFLHYVDASTQELSSLPDHDVAFLAVGESEDNRGVLANLERILKDWQRPILNNKPRQIAALTRDGVASMFADERTILAPATASVMRDRLASLAGGRVAPNDLVPDVDFPIIVRPKGTHAGHGLEKIECCADLDAYLATHVEDQFYVAPFVNYAGPDGLFRKQRIAFIDGEAFASHLAVSEHWLVHYLSAGMAAHPERRAEEAEQMQTFNVGFAERHARAFDALYRRIGLDYFVIDCAELPDGRLLLFEADIAMIVHSMDSQVTFPYKKPAMGRLFRAFERALVS